MKRIPKPDDYSVDEDVIIESNTFYITENDILKQIRTGETLSINTISYLVRDTIPDIIIRSTQDGKILGIEMGDENFSIIKQQQYMAGQYLHQVFPQQTAALHVEQIQKVLRTNRSVVYTYEQEALFAKPGHYEARIIKSNEQEVILIIRDTTVNNNEKLSIIHGIIEGEEKERKRVAQELHDGLGQIISALYMQVGTLSKKQGMDELLRAPMKLIADIISEYRAISHNLMPPILEGAGLPHVMKILCDRINATGSCLAIFRNEKFKSRPGKYVIRELYRILQELVNNATKHSGCDTLIMELNETPGHIRIIISDNGKGFDISEVKKQREGIGLKNIYTRVELIGGKVEFDSASGKGTTVLISIPRSAARNNILKMD